MLKHGKSISTPMAILCGATLISFAILFKAPASNSQAVYPVGDARVFTFVTPKGDKVVTCILKPESTVPTPDYQCLGSGVIQGGR